MLLKYLACAILIIVTLAIADPNLLFQAIIGADPYLLGLVVVLYVLNLVVKSFRWSILMRTTGEKIPFFSIFANYTLAQAINNITPGRVAGEATRIYGANSKMGVKLGAGTASVFTERLMDLTLITTIALIGVILLSPLLMAGVLNQLYLVIGLGAIANLALIYMISRPSTLQLIGKGLIKIVGKGVPKKHQQSVSSKISDFLDSFAIAVAPSKGSMTKKTLVGAGALTVAIWTNEIARVCLIVMALGAPVNIAAIVVVTSLSTLGGIILIAGSSNIFVSSAVFSAVGIDAGIAAGAGVLSALTSIWLSVPFALLAMLIGDFARTNRIEPEKIHVEQQNR